MRVFMLGAWSGHLGHAPSMVYSIAASLHIHMVTEISITAILTDTHLSNFNIMLNVQAKN